MKKILFGLLSTFTAFILFNKPVAAQEIKIFMAGSSAVLKNQLAFREKDPRVEKLEGFLESYNSPMAEYAQEFVNAADTYKIDWKLLPAIAGVESSFGKEIPYKSFNAYGWNNGNYRFKSWEDSINKIAKSLREKYFNRGLDTPYKMAPVYAPPSKRTWGVRVSYFMDQIESFGQPFPLYLTI